MLNLQTLINYEDNEGKTLLYHAVEKNDLKTIKELVELGANVNHISKYETLLTAAYRHNHFSLINNYFYSIQDKFEPRIIQSLMNVIGQDQLEMIEKFNLDLNKKVYRPLLHKAVEEGNIELIKELTNKGIDINLEDKEGNCALFYLKRKMKTQTVIEILDIFRTSGFDFNYEKNGKKVANNLIHLYEDKKKITQYIEVYKLPINFFAKFDSFSVAPNYLINESTYIKNKIINDSLFFKEKVFQQLDEENLKKININNLKLTGNNSLLSLLELMAQKNYSINTQFLNQTMIEVVARKFFTFFNHSSYTFNKMDTEYKEEIKKEFDIIKEKILSFNDLDLNAKKEVNFVGKTYTAPLFFNQSILYYLKDYIIENLNQGVVDLSKRDSKNSTVINHCLNQENYDLIEVFLKKQKIDFNELNHEGSNLVLEVAKNLNRDTFKNLPANIVKAIMWSVIDNSPFTDLNLKNHQKSTLTDELSGIGLLQSYHERAIEIEKKWLESNTHSQKNARKIKL